MNENHELQQEPDKMPIDDSPMQIRESSDAALQQKFNPRFVGVILAILIPGAAHVLSGHWKAGLSWFLSFFVIAVFLSYVLSYPHHLSSTIIVGIELLSIIYFVSLLISSYRPTKKLYRFRLNFALFLSSDNLYNESRGRQDVRLQFTCLEDQATEKVS